ncbi:hypothetical protein [Shimia sp. SDUM112013]|uniref:calcium-binding protein n=1 Tax=Shimia sp. SDUM112013 TaxID=3136160 RepID=UPI0032EF122D
MSDDDSITGGTGTDSTYGWAGNDTLCGEAGDDTLLGGPGDDSIDAGAGTDLIFGGAGNDLVVIAAQNDNIGAILDGGADSDSLLLDMASEFGNPIRTNDLRTLTFTNFETLGAIAPYQVIQMNADQVTFTSMFVSQDLWRNAFEIFMDTSLSFSLAGMGFGGFSGLQLLTIIGDDDAENIEAATYGTRI